MQRGGHMATWKDVTNYSRNTKEPLTWELKVGEFELYVTRHIHEAPTDWVLVVPGGRRVLRGNATADEAKLACEQWARTMLQEALAALE